MSAPKLVFEQGEGADLQVSLSDDGIEVNDHNSDGICHLSWQEAEHLHAWLKVVLDNIPEAIRA